MEIVVAERWPASAGCLRIAGKLRRSETFGGAFSLCSGVSFLFNSSGDCSQDTVFFIVGASGVLICEPVLFTIRVLEVSIEEPVLVIFDAPDVCTCEPVLVTFDVPGVCICESVLVIFDVPDVCIPEAAETAVEGGGGDDGGDIGGDVNGGVGDRETSTTANEEDPSFPVPGSHHPPGANSIMLIAVWPLSPMVRSFVPAPNL